MQVLENPDTLIFECFAEGRHFRFYASGRTEGFDGRVLIHNHFIRVSADLRIKAVDMACLEECRTRLEMPPINQERASPLQG